MWQQVVGAAALIIGIWLYRASLRPKKFPPGPINFPLFGSLLYVDVRNISKSLSKFRKKYGDIFSFYIGRTPVVVLNSYELIKSTLERAEYSGRPDHFSGTFFQKGKTGISTTEGKHWKEQRQFLVDYLAGLTGPGSRGFEDVIMDEVCDLKREFARTEGEPMTISYKINVLLLNVLWSVTCGRKLHPQQQEFQSVYECIDKITQFVSKAVIFSFMPILTWVLPESVTNMQRGRYYRNRFHEITDKWIRDHRQDYRGNRTADLQDAYLERINRGEDNFSSSGLAAMVREIFVIGAESESVLLRWAIRILACHPEVQAEMQAEADRVAGRGGAVTWEMQDRMPYTRAAIMEIQRVADIAPTGLLHRTVCDVSIEGYELPQGTLVMANLAACHRDPRWWNKPDEFFPGHFLRDGQVIENKEGFLPYGAGRRACPGAGLAEMQLFLVLANVLTEYTLTLPKGDKGDLGTQFKAGTAVLRNPRPYRVVVQARS